MIYQRYCYHPEGFYSFYHLLNSNRDLINFRLHLMLWNIYKTSYFRSHFVTAAIIIIILIIKKRYMHKYRILKKNTQWCVLMGCKVQLVVVPDTGDSFYES